MKDDVIAKKSEPFVTMAIITFQLNLNNYFEWELYPTIEQFVNNFENLVNRGFIGMFFCS